MRFELPHEPEIPRRRDQTAASEPAALALPESPLDRRLPLLRQPSNARPTDHVKHPPREQSQRENVERMREREHRPRRTRNGVAVDIRGVRLRAEERQLLAEAGRFRVLNLKDVERTIYHGDGRAMRSDLDYLRDRGLISIDSVAPRNDGPWLPQKRIEVVTLTEDGERLARDVGGLQASQKLYHGLVKPREAEHDAQVYRAYLKEAERIDKAGGSNLRVELDFELKSKVQKAIHTAHKADPDRDMNEIKREVAEQHELPYLRNKIEFPDARIHYDMPQADARDIDQASRTAFSDVEVVTAAYRPGHMQAKSQAGFRVYASASDRSRLATVEDEQHMLDWVMDL